MEDLRTTFRFVNGGSQYGGGGGGSLRVPAWETTRRRWPAWERPAGPPAATREESRRGKAAACDNIRELRSRATVREQFILQM